MSDIVKGVTFAGVSPENEVTPERLNNLVDDAEIQTAFLTGKAAETSLADDDYFLVFDTSAGEFKKIQKQYIVPAVSSHLTGFRGLVIRNNLANPDSQLDIVADEIVMRDSGGNMRRSLAFSRTVNIATYSAPASVDGRDFSSEGANSWYYIHAISDGVNDRSLLSTSATAPTFPTGYTYSALLGVVRNDNSSNFIRQRQGGLEVVMQPLVPQAHGVDFSAIQPSVAGTLEAVSLTKCIPPTIAATVRGYIATATTGSQLRALLATHATGTDVAPTAGFEYGWLPIVFATATGTIAGVAGSCGFELPIKNSQEIWWTSLGAVNQTLRITGYSLNLGG